VPKVIVPLLKDANGSKSGITKTNEWENTTSDANIKRMKPKLFFWGLNIFPNVCPPIIQEL
jgi:hypothetical protein